MKDVFIDFNVKFGLEKVWKWKLWVIGITLASGIISAFYAFSLQDEFRSTAAFIPPSINSISTLYYPDGNIAPNIYTAGEEDIDRTVDYLSSAAVTDSLARRFDLYNHYGVAAGNDKMFDHVFSTKNRISFSGRSLVTVECHDVDPKVAYEMCKAYVDLGAEWMEQISHRREALKYAEDILIQTRAEQQALIDSLGNLRERHKVYHTDFAGNAVSDILASQIRNDPGYAEEYDNVVHMEQRVRIMDQLIIDQEREYNARLAQKRNAPTLIWISSPPDMPTYKARPKRSIIILMTMVASLLFTSFVAIMLDRSRTRLPI